MFLDSLISFWKMFSVFQLLGLIFFRFSCKYGCTMLFTSLGCMFQGLLMKRPHNFGEAKEGLYLLEPSNLVSSNFSKDSSYLFSSESLSSNFSVSFEVSISNPLYFTASCSSKLWHIRLGLYSWSLSFWYMLIHAVPIKYQLIIITIIS